MIIISACLAGESCRYTGDGFDFPALRKLVENGKALAVCPEVLGGLPTPREPNEILGGGGYDVLEGRARVFTSTGSDKTEEFICGARSVLQTALDKGVKAAILKERSPSCGSSMIYDGSFSGKKIPGCGCTAALLIKNGIRVFSEENYAKNICFDWHQIIDT